MKPYFKIGSVDFTGLVAELKATNNDLDANGSGRDIHTGTMYRTIIADKDGLEVSMLRLWEADMVALRAALKPAFVSVVYLDPETNTRATHEMYCSSVPMGLQMYDKSRDATYYEGVSFTLTER